MHAFDECRGNEAVSTSQVTRVLNPIVRSHDQIIAGDGQPFAPNLAVELCS
jgi:hypothetical protein